MPTQAADLFLLEDLEDVERSWGDTADEGMKRAFRLRRSSINTIV